MPGLPQITRLEQPVLNFSPLNALVQLGSPIGKGLRDLGGDVGTYVANEQKNAENAWTNFEHSSKLQDSIAQGMVDSWRQGGGITGGIDGNKAAGREYIWTDWRNRAFRSPDDYLKVRQEMVATGLPPRAIEKALEQMKTEMDAGQAAAKLTAETEDFNARAKHSLASANQANAMAGKIRTETEGLQLDLLGKKRNEEMRNIVVDLDQQGHQFKNAIQLYRNGTTPIEVIIDQLRKADPRLSKFSNTEIHDLITRQSQALVDPLLKDTIKAFSESTNAALAKSEAEFSARTPTTAGMGKVNRGELDPVTSVLTSLYGENVKNNPNFERVKTYLLGEYSKILGDKADTPENAFLAIQSIVKASQNPDNNLFPDIIQKLFTSDVKLDDKLDYDPEKAKTLFTKAGVDWNKHGAFYKAAYGNNGLFTQAFWNSIITEASTRTARGDGSFAQNLDRIANNKFYQFLSTSTLKLTDQDLAEMRRGFEQIKAGLAPNLRSGLSPAIPGEIDNPANFTPPNKTIQDWTADELKLGRTSSKLTPEDKESIQNEELLRDIRQGMPNLQQTLNEFLDIHDSQKSSAAEQILDKALKIIPDSATPNEPEFIDLGGIMTPNPNYTPPNSVSKLLRDKLSQLRSELQRYKQGPQTPFFKEKQRQLQKQIDRLSKKLS